MEAYVCHVADQGGREQLEGVDGGPIWFSPIHWEGEVQDNLYNFINEILMKCLRLTWPLMVMLKSRVISGQMWSG